jgi:hypothetical protein
MGTGSYYGASTIVGPGRSWYVEPYTPHPRLPGKERKPPDISQKELLKRLRIPKEFLTNKHRGSILKALVRGQILLETGRPNPNHPTVRELFGTN